MRHKEDEENKCLTDIWCQETVGVRELMVGDLADAIPFRLFAKQGIVC